MRERGWRRANEVRAELYKNDPEWRERLRERMSAAGKLGYRRPKNMTKRQAVLAHRRAKRTVDKFIEILKDEGILPDLIIPNDDNEKAEKALRETCQIAFGPGNVKDKLSALKTVLEYTKAKPESKSKVTLNKSEDFLAAIAKDIEDGK